MKSSAGLVNRRVALVVEGGAMRGIFAAGALDVFLEHGFRPFDVVLGVSVGASNVLSFLAGQHGRMRRCLLGQMSRPEFIDPWRGLRGGHWMDLDWLWDIIEREDPLDRRSVAACGVEFGLVATSVRSGEAAYLAPGPDQMLEALKASCALPVLYRKTIAYEGEEYVDGGLGDPLPVREAYRRGARTIVVVRSRAATFVKDAVLTNRIGALALRREPGLVKACRRAGEVYRDAVAFMQSPPSDCQVLQVAPEAALATKRTSRDKSALHRDYALGRALGRDAIERFARLPASAPLDLVG